MKGKTTSPEKSSPPKISGSFTGSQENILKAVVIILGLLIVVALGALLYGIATGATGASEQIAARDKNTSGKDISYEVAVQAPEDYFVIDQVVDDGHLTVTFQNTHGDYIWRIYDLEKGALLGTIKSAWQQESSGG